MNNLDEKSPQFTIDEINNINNKCNFILKKHQETIVKSMFDLEINGYINISFNAALFKNDILIQEDIERANFQDYYYQRLLNQIKKYDFTVETKFGILADKVGAGKSFEVIGLIAQQLIPPNHKNIFYSGCSSVIKYNDNDECISTNLIIVPHNIFLQWDKILKMTKLKTYSISKNIHINYLKSVFNIYKNASTSSTIDNIEIEQCIEYYDVILISSTMLDNFNSIFNNFKWSRIFIDEIVSIKLPVQFDIKANFIWLITATPYAIKWIRKSYIHNIVASINKNVFKYMIIKNNDDYVNRSMSLPEIKQIIIRCDTPPGLKLISEFVPSDILNMLNAGNIKEAIVKLNCNVYTDDNIVKVLTNNIEKEIHNKNLELEYLEKIIPTDKKAHDENIKKIKDKITSLKNRHESIVNRVKHFKEESCPICLDNINNPAIVPCCNNMFCLECVATVKGKCPMCRTNLCVKDLLIINNQIKQSHINKKLLSKKENLLNILNKKRNGKFLIFSSYDYTNDNISKFLNENLISHAKIAGNIAVINKTIEKFTNGDIRVLLLNASNYGSGLNLQMATDIIIYHEMDLELETQVIGRAQRFGRIDQLNVYYLLHESEKSNCTNPLLDIQLDDINDERLNDIFQLDTSNNNIKVRKLRKKRDNIVNED